MAILASVLAGIVVGVIAGFFFASRKADAALELQLSTKLEQLREKTVNKTKKRVETELREELTGEVRSELKEKYDEEIRETAEQKAAHKLEEAESRAAAIHKTAELEAESIKLEAQKAGDQELKERRAELQKLEQRLSSREASLDQRADKFDERDAQAAGREERLNGREKELNEREDIVTREQERVQAELEKVAQCTAEEAKAELVESILVEARAEATQKVRELEEAALDEADKRARKVLATAVQRYAGEFVTERTVKVVQLPSDDMKGRIIGREGRNIRALEQATGVDLIVDDTPEAVTLSSFDPVRREIARRALTKLIQDGRIHPARIEEVVNKTRQEVEQIIREEGERVAYEANVQGLHPDLIKLLGRLKYRTSYGQNVLQHSLECALLAAHMAAELGANINVAKTAALLHDIGKAVDHEVQGPHALIGADIARRLGRSPAIVHAIAAHHNDEEPQSVEAFLVQAVDAISGGRPGARRETLDL